LKPISDFMKVIATARQFITCSLVLLALAAPVPGFARQADELRLFLRDGTSVVVFGDFARVGDRVAFTMCVSVPGESERLQTLTLPASRVDWGKTDEYGAAVRGARYARTQGEADYSQLTAAVARALSQVSDRKNPFERLQLAEQVHGIVATWSRDHYGYRASDVRQVEAMLDELVSELRAEAGVTQFDLNLVAPAVDPPAVQLLPPPSLQQSIEQLLRVAKASDVSADRVALMNAALRMIDSAGPRLPADWAKSRRAIAENAIAEDVRADRAYHDLAAKTINQSWKAAMRADSEGIERVLGDLARRDERMGRKRPADMAALMSTLQSHLDAARRLRLARDHWRIVQPSFLEYERRLKRPMKELSRASRPLDAIKRLSGPDPEALASMRERLSATVQVIQALSPPPELANVHATFVSACQLASRSGELRARAISTGDLQVAYDASAAAAGAAMLLAQAREQLLAALRPPELQ
jgi:hypothetical protein